MEVLVEYEYEALHDDELTLRPGDVIKNVRCAEDGWMEGDLNGKRGLFPDNFVKPKEETTQPPRREKSAGNVANLIQRMSTIGIPTGGFQPQPPAAAKKPKKRQCKALFEYQPQNEDELELKNGDVIDIIEEVEEGWWSGSFNGKSGLFPSNFVKELDSVGEDGESNDTEADEADGSGMESTATPTSPQAVSGNGVIAQPKKIRGYSYGVVDIFKEGSVAKVPLPSPETEEKKERPIPSLPSAAKPAHPNMTESPRADGDGKSKAKEYCKVTFAFVATNEDELSIKEGDVIHILSKDTGEPGWWRGEVRGREGVFPDNFVVMLPDGEKEAPTSRGSLKSPPRLESEEKPKKPPPPSKSIAPKPEVPSADKKPHPVRPEDRVDRPTPDHKPSKPAAPLVPPKKPIPPPGRGRPGSLPPKRPDKPLAPSPNLKHNGEVPSTRPKSDFEPSLPIKPKSLSGDWGEKSSDQDLMSFDELSSTSEKLSHPTVNRPKMPGRRLPAQFGGGHSPSKEVSVEKFFKIDEEDPTKPKLTETRKPSKEVSVEKFFKIDEEDPTKPKLTETRKPSTNTLSQSASFHKPHAEAKPSAAAAPSSDGASQGGRARLEPEEPSSQLDELRSQMKELLMSVELLKAQQMKEIAELREQLDKERLQRMALQAEVEKLKRTVHST